MPSPKTCAQGSSSSVPPDYIIGTGVDKHAIKVRSKLYPFAQKNLDENVLHLFENTLVLGPHCVSKALLHWPLTPGLLPRYVAQWRRAGIYDAILLLKQSVNRDENLLDDALCFWNSISNTHLAEALHNHTDVGFGPVLATLENPLNLSVPGAFWMIQIWLQVYFPKLRFLDIILPENQVLALPLISTKVPKRSIEDYLMFFGYCTKRSVAQWQVVIRRTYPWFRPGYGLFEKGPEEETARIDFRKKFLHVTLPRDLPHGGGKPLNYHLGAEVYHPNFCARQLGCPQLIPLKSYRSYNRATSWRGADDLKVHKDARCAVNKINNSANALYPTWDPNSSSSAEFDAWWKASFQGLPASCIALKTIKDINAQVIEDPSLTRNIGGQSVQAGEVFVTSVIAVGDLELPSGDEDDETLVEQPVVEVTPFWKWKETARAQDSAARPAVSVESPPPPPPNRSKRLRKRTRVESDETEEPAAVPTETSGTDDELREAFEAVEQEKEKEKEGEEVPVKEKEKEKEKHCLGTKQQIPRTELTSSELALFEDAEAEHSTAVLGSEEQAAQSVLEPVEQAELSVVVPEAEVEVIATVPGHVVKVPRTAGVLAVMTSPFKPPIVVMPIHSFLGSSTTASFADTELAEFEAMDLDAQLDKLEKLSSTPGKAKSKAVEEAMERLKIWKSTEVELDEDKEAVDQLMKDLDLLHRQNMAPKPVLEMGLGLARDVLNLHNRYEDLKPTFKTSGFCKATHEANLADYAKQKAELDQMVAGYKEAKATADRLEKQSAWRFRASSGLD
ncbi:unnamed protein product [Prunus armeniaca]